MKKQTYKNCLHCVQCGEEFIYKCDLDNTVVSICSNPKCPNYALLAMPLEQMPKDKK